MNEDFYPRLYMDYEKNNFVLFKSIEIRVLVRSFKMPGPKALILMVSCGSNFYLSQFQPGTAVNA